MDEKLKAQVAERKEFNLEKRKRGRPKQSEVKAKKRGNRNAVGRPKGDAAIINDYKSRMLASPQSKLVLQSIFDAALNDEHKHQAAAWKMLIDRLAPIAAFEKDVAKDGGRSAIQINIVGVNQVDVPDQPVVQEDAIIEGEFND